MSERNLLTIEETAEQVKRAPYTVREWAKRREHLPFVRIGRKLYVDQRDIDRYLARQTLEPVAQSTKSSGGGQRAAA
jgi:excisionase family DNA binding protein